MSSFFNNQFNYCSLIWMLLSCHSNSKIQHLHERCVRLIYNDKSSCYEEQLEKDKSVSVRHKNLQSIITEIFKIKDNISPEIPSKVFLQIRESLYNLTVNQDFLIPSSVRTESISYLVPKIWDMVLTEIRKTRSIN